MKILKRLFVVLVLLGLGVSARADDWKYWTNVASSPSPTTDYVDCPDDQDRVADTKQEIQSRIDNKKLAGKPWKCCPPAKGKPTLKKSLSLDLDIGPVGPDTALPSGTLSIYAKTPSDSLYTRQGVTFRFGYTMVFVSTNNLTSNGVPRSVTILGSSGEPIVYEFADNVSTGLPTGQYSASLDRLVMKGTNFLPVTTSPRYYDLIKYNCNMSVLRYGADPAFGDYKGFIRYTTPYGRTATLDDGGIKVVNDEYNILRQINMPMYQVDLADLGPASYEMRFYAGTNKGSWNVSSGLYDSFGAPFVTWRVENNGDSNVLTKCLISQIMQGKTNEFQFVYASGMSEWTLTSGAGLKNESKSEVWDDNHQYRLETVTITDSKSNILSQSTAKYFSYSFGERLVEETTGYGSDTLTNATYTYYPKLEEYLTADFKNDLKTKIDGGLKKMILNNQIEPEGLGTLSWYQSQWIAGCGSANVPESLWSLYEIAVIHAVESVFTNSTPKADFAGMVKSITVNTGKEGRMASVRRANGSWATYEYDINGRQIVVKEGVKDAAYGDTNNVKVTSYAYSPHLTNDVVDSLDTRARTVAVSVNGATNSVSYYAYFYNESGEKVEVMEQCPDPSYTYGNTNNLRTETITFSTNATHAEVGRTKSSTSPDSQKTTYSYEYGDYNENANPSLCSFSVNSNGSCLRRTDVYGTVNSPNGIAYKTLKKTTIFNQFSLPVMEETYVYTGSTYERISWTVTTYDDRGRAEHVYYSDGTQDDTGWSATCCSRASTTDKSGTERLFGYDLLDRLISDTKKGINSPTGDIKTEYTLDAAGQQLMTKITGDSLSMVTSSNTFDTLGNTVLSVDSLLIPTTYSRQNGGRISTTIRAGVTNVTENYLDGRTKCSKLNGVIQQYFEYGINVDGTSWIITYTGPDGTNSPMWQKSTTDLLGRTVRTEQPGYGGTVITNESFFNNLGQLVRTTSSQQPATLLIYNEVGEQIRSGLDVDGDGTLDLAEMDRISESTNYYEKVGDDWWQTSVSMLYAGNNSAVVTTNSIQRTKLSGLWAGGLASFAVSADILGNQTISSTVIDRANKTVTQTTTYPDSTNSAVSISVNGLAVSSTSKTGIQTTFGFDALERQISTTDPRIGTSTVHINAKGQIDWTEDAASNKSWFAYDPDTGRQIAITDALSNAVCSAYDNAKGLLLGTWGATYPVAYEFDSWNRMTAMYTYRGTNSIASYSDLESLKSSMDRTQWKYELASGLLTNKLYADNKGPSYTYTSDGKLASRIWSRSMTNGQPLVTFYVYTNTGDMVSIGYSDSTPGVGFTYNRLGQQITITDGQGTRAFTYNDALQLASETNVMGQITRTYDNLGRYSGFYVGPDLASAPYSVSYGYSSVGRFISLSSSVQSVTSVVNYAYLPNSDMISVMSNSVVQFEKAFEQHRNFLTQVKNTFGTNLISQFDYVNDELGRRTQRIDSGSSVASNSFGYNPRSELINASMGANSYAWDLDSIGNRISDTSNSVTHSYTANSLNQYTQITNGGIRSLSFDLDGNMTQSVTLSNDGATTNQYSWDAENRLTSIFSNGNEIASYKYDYMSRRYEKVVKGMTNQFVWNGWLLLEEQTRSNDGVITNIYNWGLDLSGTMQGAGGIGGLLSVTRITSAGIATYYPVADANGNITDYVDTNGTVVAHREFDAYGNTIASSGAVNDFNFWFSSKYLDEETGLYYYGHRSYSPQTGRWLSREPIGERGGKNIYAFVKNNTFSFIDYLGLAPQQTIAVSDGPGGYTDPDSAQSYMTPGMVTPLFGPAGNYQGLGPGLYTTPNTYYSGFHAEDDWFFGRGGDRQYGQNDTWSVEMRASAIMEIDRERMRAEIRSRCQNRTTIGPVTLDLGGELGEGGIPWYQYAALTFRSNSFLYAVANNPTAAHVGSWTSGTMATPEVDCCRHVTTLRMHAINVGSVTSHGHLPPWRIFGRYGNHSVFGLVGDNPFGTNGWMHNVTETFEWEEELEF